jgi:hypothetical protein
MHGTWEHIKMFLIFPCTHFGIVSVVLKYLKFAIFSKDLLATFMLPFSSEFCSLDVKNMLRM